VRHILALAALLACSHGGRVVRLELPQSWDDRRLEAAMHGSRSRAVLAVLPFDNGPSGIRIADLVTTAIVKAGRVDLVERDKMEKVLDEQRLRLTGAIDDASKAAEVGKLLGAEAVIFGAVTNATQQTTDRFAYDVVRTEVRIDARAVDTTTGRVLFAESGAGASETKIIRSADGTLISGLRDAREEYRKAAEQATSSVGGRLAQFFPALGFVLRADGDRVVVDLGTESGVGPGDLLIAFRPLQRLVHPVTQQELGWEKQLIDVLVVRSIESRSSVLERKHAGDASLRAGDVVVWSAKGEAP
jgi:hypothetical protein